MKDDFDEYERMKKDGASPEAVYRAAKDDGLDGPACFRLLRSVFALDLAKAKEVMLRADGVAKSLGEHQKRIAPALKKALDKKS